MYGIAVVLYFITSTSSARHRTVAIIWLLVALFPLIFSVSTSDPNWRHIRAMGNTCLTDLLLLAELGWLILISPKTRDLPNTQFSSA